MSRWFLSGLVASFLFAACGTAPIAPTPPAIPAPPAPAPAHTCAGTPTAPAPPGTSAPPAPTLSVTVSPEPFRVGVPGEIHYEVTGVTLLASVAYAWTDGANQLSATSGPVPACGTLHSTYRRAGAYTVTVTATTLSGSALQETAAVTVVD